MEGCDMPESRTNDDRVFYRNPKKFYPTAERAEGIYIYDTEGKRYIDGSGGAVVVGIGHGVKEITDAMVRQANKIAFSHGSQFASQPAVELAAKLVDFSPKGLTRVYFSSGGSEAIETTVKLARQYQVERGKPSKYKVISRWTSYHGCTLGALALSGHTYPATPAEDGSTFRSCSTLPILCRHIVIAAPSG
jgi:adenosylmethionine-8-amino-7-oxononanoate aminotransferase